MLFYHSTFKNSTSDLKSKGRENHIFWLKYNKVVQDTVMLDNNTGMPLRFQVAE